MGKPKAKVSKRQEPFSGKKKTFGEDEDFGDGGFDEGADLEALEEVEESAGKHMRGKEKDVGSGDDEDDAPEEGGMDGVEMQRLREMFEKHAPREGAKKKRKRKPRPAAEQVDPSDMLDAAVLEGIDSGKVDAHREVIESDQQGEDNDDDGNEVRRNDKGGLKIDKNKRGSRIIGDIHVKVLGKEDPVKMLIKSSGSRKGNKMADLLGEKERESYSVFASQKKRQRAGKFVQ